MWSIPGGIARKDKREQDDPKKAHSDALVRLLGLEHSEAGIMHANFGAEDLQQFMSFQKKQLQGAIGDRLRANEEVTIIASATNVAGADAR
jgi:hypothetical protein